MKLSARNALKGRVIEILKGQIMAKIKVDIGGQTVTSMISIEAVEELDLKIGDAVEAIVKSSEVMIAK